MSNKNSNSKTKRQKKNKIVIKKSPLRVFMLGGLGEIGKNLSVIEYEDELIVIDCGLGFPDGDMLGIDLVVPDITYLKENEDKIKGFLITHGHEDHIGALPYVLRTIHAPVYGTALTLGILENKLSEFKYELTPELVRVSAGDVVKLGKNFEAEFIHVNHSIADACAIAVRTPQGTVLHTGDFKLDLTPVDGQIMDITRLGEYGNEGVRLLMCESTNVERPGLTPSERLIGGSLDSIFLKNKDKRIIIATFSSNVHRVQQILNTCRIYGRKVAITGRSMNNIVEAAADLGYIDLPDGLLVDIGEISNYNPEKTVIITTGSQGEPMSGLYRMAFSEHAQVNLGRGDMVVLSSHAIPGNEKLVDRVVNELYRNGVSVFHDDSVEVHVSGHACREELKLMHALTNPEFFMPIHGEYKHLSLHRDLALEMGMDDGKIFLPVLGKVLEIDSDGAKWNGYVQAGNVLIDGSGVGDVGNIVLRDRKHLSEGGLIVMVASVDMTTGEIVSGPEIISRGFVYMRESEELLNEAKSLAENVINSCLEDENNDRNKMKQILRDELSRYFYAQTRRRPVILPIIMEL